MARFHSVSFSKPNPVWFGKDTPKKCVGFSKPIPVWFGKKKWNFARRRFQTKFRLVWKKLMTIVNLMKIPNQIQFGLEKSLSSVNALNLEPIPILLLISAFHGPLASPIFREHEFRSPDSTNHQGKLQKGKALNHTYLPKSPFFMSVSRSCSRSLSAARGHDLIKKGICVEEIWIDLLSLTILSSILDMKIQYVMPFQGESDLVFRLYTHTKVFNFVGIRVQRIMKAHLGGEKSQDLEILERKIYFYFFQ